MARQFYGNVDLVNNQLLNFAVQVLATPPTGFLGQLIYDSTDDALKYYDGAQWVTLGQEGAGGPPSGAAGGDLDGTYPNPSIKAGAVNDDEVGSISLTKIAGHDSAAHSAINAGTASALATARTISLTGGVTGSTSFDGSANVSITATVDFSGYVPDTRTITSGNGLTGGGNLTTNRTLAVGAGTGITVNADDVAVNRAVVDTWYDAAGTGAGAVSTHEAAGDPHPGYQLESGKGVANGYVGLDANALIPTTHLPPLAVNEVFTAADQTAMLALTAQRGDMAIRTDNGKTYVLSTDDPTTLADWKEVTAAGSVVSVNGDTGVVVLDAADVGAVPTTRTVSAGNGLTGGGALSGNITLNVGAGNGITVAADTVAVQAADGTLSVAGGGVSVVSAPKWTTGRTISLTGAVTGTSAAFDGSGNLSIVTSFGAAPGYAADLTGTASEVVTHNLGTRDVAVTVYRTSGNYEEVEVEVERTSTNTVTLKSNPALGAGFRAVVVKGA